MANDVDLDGHIEQQPDGKWTVTVTVAGLLTEQEALSICEGLKTPTLATVQRLTDVRILNATDLN